MKAQEDYYQYVKMHCVGPFQYEFVLRDPAQVGESITLLHQFESDAAALQTAQHYEALLQRAHALGYTLRGYYFLSPSGHTLPVSHVFDLDMTIQHVEHMLNSR